MRVGFQNVVILEKSAQFKRGLIVVALLINFFIASPLILFFVLWFSPEMSDMCSLVVIVCFSYLVSFASALIWCEYLSRRGVFRMSLRSFFVDGDYIGVEKVCFDRLILVPRWRLFRDPVGLKGSIFKSDEACVKDYCSAVFDFRYFAIAMVLVAGVYIGFSGESGYWFSLMSRHFEYAGFILSGFSVWMMVVYSFVGCFFLFSRVFSS